MNYTKEQEQAIFLRDKNIMVSAGAGAGKTRVLVSRMAELIMDEKNPVEADRFLVMTFTNAAEAEMKERISLDLEERLAKDPENHYLRKQIRKIRQADISTVHSFCNHLIRTHYNELSIDPSFRIGEEGELFLLRQQAIEQLLEEAYASGRESFVKFAESYAPGKSDKVLEELVGDLYRFSRSFPNASFWFEKTKQEALQLAEAKEWDNSPAVMLIFLKAKKELLQEKEALSKLLKNIAGEEVPEKYGVLLQDVSEYVEALSQTESYDAYYMVLSRGSVPAFPRATKKDKEWADYEIVKEWHQEVKELLQKQKETVFTAPAEELQREAAGIYPLLEEYIVLAQRFEEIYLAYKKEKNVYVKLHTANKAGVMRAYVYVCILRKCSGWFRCTDFRKFCAGLFAYFFCWQPCGRQSLRAAGEVCMFICTKKKTKCICLHTQKKEQNVYVYVCKI